MTTTTTTNAATVTVRRAIQAPAAELFDAWLDPASLMEFMSTSETKRCTATLDARVGGAYEIVMHAANKDHVHRGHYKVIERPRRLVFTWTSEHTGYQESLVTVEFKGGKGTTEVVITHERLPDAMAQAHTQGWTDILGMLAKRMG
jgi:uncharacterized protein YndB with AHSA1/START domain